MAAEENQDDSSLIKREDRDSKPGMSRRTFLVGSAAAGLVMGAGSTLRAPGASAQILSSDSLEESFRNPPSSAQVWTYWWWLNGYVTREGIVKDLDAMKQQGISGVLVFNAGGGPTPKSIEFMSQEWRDLFRFAVEEASKREMEVSLNLCSGWDAGGPWVTAAEAPQELVFSKLQVTGPRLVSEKLPEPHHVDAYYRDLFLVAYRVGTKLTATQPIGEVGWSDPGSYPFFYPQKGDKDHAAVKPAPFCVSNSMVDLSADMDSSGHLNWKAPEGEWVILRCGHTPLLSSGQSHTKVTGSGDQGYEIDPYRADMMDKQFAETAGKILPDVQPWAGRKKTLQYFHIDSWEVGKPTWTAKLRDEFKQRRGYDLMPFLAVLAGEQVDSHETTARFMEDFDRTLSDLTVENYYGRLAELSHQHGIDTHPESEGPELFCVDSLRALGTGDVMMSEYWSRLTEPDGYIWFDSPASRRWLDGVKGASSAAHIYGKSIIQAEAFTSVARIDWSEYPFALKALGDRAFCAGLNRNVLCFYVHQPEADAIPGYEWPRCGLKADRNVTWFPMSHAWLRYLARCQNMFQRGRFIADVCYFYGEGAPNFVPGREAMDPPLPEGYDCDSINAEALLSRMTVQDGKLRLPGGMSYRVLVLPYRQWPLPAPVPLIAKNEYPGPGNGLPVGLSAEVLRKIKELVEDGATILGSKPTRAPGLSHFPQCDAEVKQLAAEIWGDSDQPAGERKLGKGRVIWGKQIGDIFRQDGVTPDFTFRSRQPLTDVQYIHYSIDGADCYFVSNQSMREESVDCTFRVTGRVPELWDAVTGQIRSLPEFETNKGRTTLAMKFAPRQSFFVLFRKPGAPARQAGKTGKNFPRVQSIRDIEGAWEVSFEPRWGGPAKVTFDQLEDWTQRPEEGIRYYSGTARYSKTFDLPERGKWDRLFLDLGIVNYLASVRLNGKDLGVVWTAPWRVDITGAARPRGNVLEIDVVNLWPNRLIGDAKLPEKDRLTRTNVRPDPGWPLFPSGLLGPVSIQGMTV